MKITRHVLFALLLLGIGAGAASAQVSVGAGVRVGPQGHASVDLGFFYDSLAPYGNWIERPSHGWVWTPREVSSTWRPYQAGHWVWSDEGWTWLSDEPYGWATYHYGRWYQDPEIGWAWVPGNDWAPAWVSWQEGNDYVGWAPLPPGANVNASNTTGPGYAGPGYDNGPGPGYDDNPGYDDEPGYNDNPGYGDDPAYEDDPGYEDGPAYDDGPSYDDNYRYDDRPTYGNGPVYGGGYGYGNYAYGIAPSAYLFVPTQAFLSVNLFDVFVPWVRVSSFFYLTRNCTSYGFYGGHYFNRGIPFEHVRHYYNNVPRYRLAGLDGFRGHGYHAEGNRLSFFRPQVSRGWRGTPLDRAGARRSVVSARQFRNDHPDRQRSYAQINGQRSQINGQRFGRAQRDNGQGSSRQAQGDRGGRNVPRRQDQASRQRSFENGRAQADRRQQYNAQRQQYNTRQWQQDQANRQRSYDRQRSQPQEGWQRRQYNVQPQPRQQYQRQQQYQPRQQQPRQQQQRQQFQPQRQAPPRQQYRSNAGQGQANRGQDHHGNDRRRHGG